VAGRYFGGSEILGMRVNPAGRRAGKALLPPALKKCFLFLVLLLCFAHGRAGAQAPPVPTGLTLLPPYDGQVNLLWVPDTAATPTVTAYLIYRQLLLAMTCSPTPTATGSPVFTSTATVTPTPIATVLLSNMSPPGTPDFVDSQVTNGRSYLYQVQGTNMNGTGPAAAVTAAPYFAPFAVQPVTVLSIHANALDLFWGVPASSYPVSDYWIYRYVYTPLITSTPTNTFTNTETPTNSPSPTPTMTPTDTQTITQTDSPTNSATDSPTGPVTPVLTDTSTETTTDSPTATNSSTPSYTPTFTITLTPSSTDTSTPTPTAYATIAAAVILETQTPLAVVSGTTYSDTTADPNAALAYYYLVMAVDSQDHTSTQGTTATSPALPPLNAPPGPPVLSGLISNTVVPQIGSNGYGVRLFWTGSLLSEGVTAYQVLRDNTPIATMPYGIGTPAATATYDDAAVPATGNPVNYVVQAQNPFGSTNSNNIEESIVPAVEGQITVVPNATTTPVVISWSPASPGTYGLAGYALYRSLNGVPTNNPTPIPPGLPTATITPTPFATVAFSPSVTFTITPITDSPIVNHMSYWVQPIDSTGHGGEVGVATPNSFNLAPTPPTEVSVSVVSTPAGNNQFNLSWQPGAPGFYGTAQDYVIYRTVVPYPTSTPTGTQTPLATPTPTYTGTLAPIFTQTAIATVPYGQNSYIDIPSGFSTGTTIGYQLGLVDSMGTTSDLAGSSNVVTISALMVPSAPKVLPFTGSYSSIQFSWLQNPAADSVTNYLVYSGQPTMTVGATEVATVSSSASTLYFFPSPTPWAANLYYLIAQNAIGTSQPATMNGIPVTNYNVSAVIPAGTQQVSVSWNLTPTVSVTPVIDTYTVYRSLTPDANFSAINSVPVTTNSYADVLPVATYGVTYYYRVTAKAAQVAESPLYPVLTPDPQGSVLTLPNAISGFTAQSAVNQTTLYWVGNPNQEGVTSYSVYINGTQTPVINIGTNTTPSPTYSYVATETPGNLSSYAVVANNSTGSSSPQTISVLVPPSMTPNISLTPPTYVIPSAATTPGVWISGLSYPAMTPTWVNEYSIYRQSVPTPSVTPSASPTFALAGSVSAPVSFFEDTGYAPGYVNNYQVVAGNQGLGLNANPTVSAPLAVTLFPNPPNISLTGNSTSVTVSWATPVGNVNFNVFNIYRSVYPTITPTLIATVQSTPSILNYPDSAVTPGTAYVYWMDAQNTPGHSALSAPQSFIPVQVPTLYITPLPERNQLFWAPITVATTSPVTGYAIYRAAPTPSQTPIFAQVGSIVEPLSNTNYVDSTNLSDGVSYIYEIAPSSQNNILGPFSNPVTQYDYPQPVTDLIAVSGNNSVQLEWNYQGVATNTVLIQRKLGPASGSSAFQTIKTGQQGVNFIDTGVLNKNFYVYHVYTVDAQGLTSTAFASALALPAIPPILPVVTTSTSSGSNISGAPVTLTQNSSNAQTLIGNTLSWGGADQPSVLNPSGINPDTMYPLGGYSVSRSSDGGGVYQDLAIVPVTFVDNIPTAVANYFDQVQLINGSTLTYLVQAFDNPPDLPVALAAAVTEGLVHVSPYNPVTAYPISPNTALDRNAIRPFGASNEQLVNIRFIVTAPGNVTIKVYTLDGTFIEALVNKVSYQPGIYWTSWDAHNMNRNLVASGVYLITTESPGGHQEFSKVAVIK
jgi:hypothetical protein